MRYEDMREGLEVFGRSLGRVFCIVCVCAPAAFAYHLTKESESDWDILVFWGGVAISIFFLCASFAMFGEQKRHRRESFAMTLRNIQDAKENRK